MATKSKIQFDTRMVEESGFDVTCSIGRVMFGEGEDSPQVAAFKLIAEHGANGNYTFPAEDGGTYHVDVYHEPPSDEAVR